VKVLLDTNVLVAAFVAHGTCHEVFEHCLQHHQIVTTEKLISEFRRVLADKMGFPRRDVREAAALVRSVARVVEPAELEQRVCRDADDDEVLAAALGDEVACVVTGDRDLLVLEVFRGIPLLSPDRFWRFEAE
jgi:putative PIN family toxin of toxin-antitoxin system